MAPHNFWPFFTLVKNPRNSTNALAVCNWCITKHSGRKNIEREFIKYLRNEQIIITQNITNVNVNINMGHYWEISKILNDHFNNGVKKKELSKLLNQYRNKYIGIYLL